MDARICSNPACHTIQTGYKCSLCNASTNPLSPLSLTLIGVDGAARLIHTPSNAYAIQVNTRSGNRTLDLPMSDLLHSSQMHLPHINAASGLTILDALKLAATLIRTVNPDRWAGWVAYLLDVLEQNTDAASFQVFLTEVHNHVNDNLARNETSEEPT